MAVFSAWGEKITAGVEDPCEEKKKKTSIIAVFFGQKCLRPSQSSSTKQVLCQQQVSVMERNSVALPLDVAFGGSGFKDR